MKIQFLKFISNIINIFELKNRGILGRTIK